MKFPVNELFETIQGEAKFTGTPAVFIRLQGCPVGCPWCDTKHTWPDDAERVTTVQMLEKTADAPSAAMMDTAEIVATVRRYRSRHVVITGGEPCRHDLRELTQALSMAGRFVQIETSGTAEVRVSPDTFVTVSPKIGMPGGLEVRPDAIRRADEIKHPVGKMADVEALLALLGKARPWAKVWLQPLSQSPKATALCIEQAIANGFRVSLQTHKYIGAR